MNPGVIRRVKKLRLLDNFRGGEDQSKCHGHDTHKCDFEIGMRSSKELFKHSPLRNVCHNFIKFDGFQHGSTNPSRNKLERKRCCAEAAHHLKVGLSTALCDS